MTQLPKYIQKEVDNEEPRVLVEFQKHQTIYWNATGKERLLALALRILQFRMSYGFFRTSKEIQKELDQQKDPIPNDEISNIPKALVNAAITVRLQYRNQLDKLKDELRHAMMAEKAIENNDGALAWLLLNERTDYEYERIELHTLL